MITKPVFLCGYTSSGKTTVGKELAKQLGVPFFDTDKLLEQQTGQTPQQIFAEKGESYFRDLEHEIARQTTTYPPCVISTGGGMLIAERNGKLLSEHGTIIHLNRPFEDCYRSLMQNPDRPLIKNNTKEELRERYEKRAVSYQAYADFTVKNDRTPKLTAQRIMAFLELQFTDRNFLN